MTDVAALAATSASALATAARSSVLSSLAATDTDADAADVTAGITVQTVERSAFTLEVTESALDSQSERAQLLSTTEEAACPNQTIASCSASFGAQRRSLSPRSLQATTLQLIVSRTVFRATDADVMSVLSPLSTLVSRGFSSTARMTAHRTLELAATVSVVRRVEGAPDTSSIGDAVAQDVASSLGLPTGGVAISTSTTWPPRPPPSSSPRPPVQSSPALSLPPPLTRAVPSSGSTANMRESETAGVESVSQIVIIVGAVLVALIVTAVLCLWARSRAQSKVVRVAATAAAYACTGQDGRLGIRKKPQNAFLSSSTHLSSVVPIWDELGASEDGPVRIPPNALES